MTPRAFGTLLFTATFGAYLAGAVTADSPAVLFGLGASLIFFIKGRDRE